MSDNRIDLSRDLARYPISWTSRDGLRPTKLGEQRHEKSTRGGEPNTALVPSRGENWETHPSSLLVMGAAARASGNEDEALSCYVKACQLYDAIDDVAGVARSLGAVAGIHARVHPYRSAVLFGAAERLLDDHGIVRPIDERSRLHRDIMLVRRQLSFRSFIGALAEGVALSGREALALALGLEPEGGWSTLTTSERAVVTLVAEGLTNAQVARLRGISPRTVQAHLTHVFAKLGITTRTALARMVAHAPRYSAGSSQSDSPNCEPEY